MYYMQGLQDFEAVAIWVVFGIAIVGLLYALVLRSQILGEDKGTEKMQEVWNAIKDGANAYLQKQFRSILPLIAVLTVALFLSVCVVPPSPEARAPRARSASSACSRRSRCTARARPVCRLWIVPQGPSNPATCQPVRRDSAARSVRPTH